MRDTGLRRLTAGATALLAVLLAGCDLDTSGGTAAKAAGTSSPTATTAPDESGPSPDDSDPTPEDEAAIRALMADRARAVMEGDAKAFRATVDPRQPKLVASQMTLFHNLEALPLDSLTYNVSTVYLVPAHVPGGDPVLHPQMLEQLQLSSTMVHPLSNKLDVTLVKRGKRWLVGAEREPGAKGAVEKPQERPWFGAAIAVHHEGRLTVLVDRANEDRLAGLVDVVQSGVERDAAVLGVEPDTRVLVDATSNGEAESFGAGVKEKVGAVTFPMVSTLLDDLGGSGEGQVAGTAIKINPTDVEELLDEDRLLWHELTHYLLIRHAVSSPVWLSEGVASWSEWQPTRMSGLVVPDELYDDVQRRPHELPTRGVFYDDPAANYLFAQAAVQWLVDRNGTDRLLELMKSYDGLLKGVGDTDVDASTVKALRRVYGISEKELVNGAFETLATLHH